MMTGKIRRMARAKSRLAADEPWELCLYVTGQTIRSRNALANTERLCREHLAGRCHIEVVDLLTDPGRARQDQIVAIPTLVRRHPLPVRTVIGDLSDTQRALEGLDVLAFAAGQQP